MKKILTIVVAFILVTSTLAGCAKKEDQQTSGNNAQEKTKNQEKEAAEEKAVTLEWLAYNSYGQPNNDAFVVETVKERFNVDFNFWFLDDKNWNDSLNVKLAGGDMPDIMRLRNNVPTLVEQGILAEIPLEMIKENAPDYYKAVNAYADDYNAWMYNSYEGKNYSLPRLNLGGKYPTVLVWRKDWLEAVGYSEPPKTLEEFEDVMYKFRNNDPDGNNKKDTYGMSETVFEAIYGAFGIQCGNPIEDKLKVFVLDGEPSVSVTRPEAKDALSYLSKWYKDGVIDPEFVTGENTGGYWALSHAFMNNRVGVTGEVMYGHYIPKEIKNDNGGACIKELIATNPDAEVVLSAPPIGPNGKMGTPAWGIAGEGFGITTNAMKDPKKMEKIWQIVNEPYVDAEYNKLITYGVENEDYKLVDGVITSLNEGGAGDGEKKGISVFIPNFNATAPKTEKEVAYANETSNFNGYVECPLPLSDARQKYSASLAIYKQEIFMDIITGEKPLDHWETFVEEFRSMGGQEVEEEIIKQYNDLLAN